MAPAYAAITGAAQLITESVEKVQSSFSNSNAENGRVAGIAIMMTTARRCSVVIAAPLTALALWGDR
jgi:hypothetical protein